MSTIKQSQSFQITITILSVKMKIKFPCRMALEHNKQLFTAEVAPNDNHKFQFNQEIVLRSSNNNTNFQLLCNLMTDKGTKYTSGTVKLLAGELARSKGQRIIAPIEKCLDPDAFCEIKVEYTSSRLLRRESSKVLQSPVKVESTPPQESKQLKKISSQRYLIGQTRSQFNLNPMFSQGFQQGKREQGPKSQFFKTFTKSPVSKFSNVKYLTSNVFNGFNARNNSEFPVQEVNSVTSPKMSFAAQNQVYRQGYNKLKEKYKKESQLWKQETHKRMVLQANENNYKLQIMKLKLRCQQQQKQLAQKNEKVRNLTNNLNQFQKKDLDLAYLREQCASWQRKSEIKQETILTLSKDNEALKKLMVDKWNMSQETIKNLRAELELARSKIDEQKYQYDLALQAKENILLGKNNDIQLRNDTIARQKKLVKQLEEQAEAKLFDFEKQLAGQKATLQKKIDQFKTQISNFEGIRKETTATIAQLNNDIYKLKTLIQSLEYAKKVMEEQGVMMRNQIEQLRVVKQRYVQLTKQHKFLNDQFITVRKNLQLSLSNKDVNLNELISKYQQGRARADKTRSEQDQKIKNVMGKQQETQLNLQVMKVALQKSKRAVDNLTKENASLREQNSLIRQQCRMVQKRLINVQSQYSTINARYQRQQANYSSLLSKYKDQRDHLQRQSDSYRAKYEHAEQARKRWQEKGEEWKAKERHLQEKLEKEQTSHKEIVTRWEQVNLDLQQNLGHTQSLLEQANRDKKTLKNKNNDLELLSIQTRDTIQRLRKQIKVKDEKSSGLQLQLGQKTQQLVLSQQLGSTLQQKIQQKQQNILHLKENLHEQINKSSKKTKMNELIAADLKKANQNIQQLTFQGKKKDETEQALRKELKISKEEIAKQKLRGNKIQIDFIKFREIINDVIRVEFSKILKSPISTQINTDRNNINTQRNNANTLGIANNSNTQRLRQSAVSRVGSVKSFRQKDLDAASIANCLVQRLQDVKGTVGRLSQFVRVLKQQNIRLLQASQSETHRYEFTQVQMQRDIQLLENEVDNILTDKQAQCENYDKLLVELNFKLKQREGEISQLRLQIQEYQGIITELRNDFESNNQLNQKKSVTFKVCIAELNQRIDYLNLNVACLQDKNHQSEQRVIQLENELLGCKQLLIKNEKSLLDLQQSQTKLIAQLEVNKKQLKRVGQILGHLQIQVGTQRETKQKYRVMLEQEQSKAVKMTQFVAGLITQKEIAIKSQLERTEEVNGLENKLLQCTHQRDLANEDSARNRKKIQEVRQQLRVMAINIKLVEKQLSQEKVKLSRTTDKLKQRQSDIQLKKQYIKQLQGKYGELRDKNYKEIRELSDQLDDKNIMTLALGKELNEKIFKIQSENKKVWEDNLGIKGELESMTQQFYLQKDANEDLQGELRVLRQENINLQDELAGKQLALMHKNQEMGKMEVLLFDQRRQIQQITQQFSSSQRQYNINITDLTYQFNFKMETLAKQHQQRQQLTDRQLQYLRQKIKQVEVLFQHEQSQRRVQNTTAQETRLTYEEKLKKIEAQRMTATLTKNSEIKKMAQENKILLERNKEKEAQVRRLGLDLQQIRLTLTRTETMSGHNLQQGKNRQRVLEKEIQALKLQIKQVSSQRQKLRSAILASELQVRRLISTAIKKAVQVCSKTQAEKILIVTKGLQNSVIQAMSGNLDK